VRPKRREGAKVKAPAAGVYLFTSRDGTPYTTDGFRSVFFRARDRAKIADLTFHDLRHTAACRMRRAGVGLDTIKEILGHSDIRVTMRYARVDKHEKQAAVEKLPAPVGITQPFLNTSSADAGKGL